MYHDWITQNSLNIYFMQNWLLIMNLFLNLIYLLQIIAEMESQEYCKQQKKIYLKKDSEYRQLAELQKSITQLYKSNSIKYKCIIQAQSSYECQLYVPNQSCGRQKAFKRQLLLRQLDHLLDQEGRLNKKLTELNFKKQSEIDKQKQYLQVQVNPYSVLRSIWSKYNNQKNDYHQSIQKVEGLNYIVGVVKNSIQNMIKVQQKYICKFQNHLQQRKVLYNNSKQQKIQMQYERNLMQNEQFRNQIIKLTQKIYKKEQVICQLQQKIEQLIKQQQSFKKLNENMQINYKLKLSQLNQVDLTLRKTINQLTKQSLLLKKCSIKSQSNSFNMYFELPKDKLTCFQSQFKTSKAIEQVIDFLREKSNSNNQIQADQNQQNASIIIPTLNLGSNLNVIKKNNTDRPLKQKRNQMQKFFTSNACLKYNKIQNVLNDQSCKKFIRKNQILNSSRKICISQFSDIQKNQGNNQKQKE